MSSHHVIRDGQEPPLLIISPEVAHLPVLGELLEWAPVVMCLATCIQALADVGTKVDLVFCQTGDPPLPSLPYKLEVEEWKDWDDLIDRIRRRMFNLQNHQLHVLSYEPEQVEKWQEIQGVTFFDHIRKWTCHRERTYKKWFPSGCHLIIKGKYKASGSYELTQTGIRTTQDGFIQIESSEMSWVGEPY